MTVKDVAQLLGISHTTVSRALANSEKISDETKERVRAAAAQLGYVANSGARLMRQGESMTVGLLLPNVTSEFYSTLAQTLTDSASQRGLQLVLSLTGSDPEREAKAARAMFEARPRGIMATLCAQPLPETLALLNQAYCVQFLGITPELPQIGVVADGAAASKLAVDHLAELGHRRIGFIGIDLESSLGVERLAGFEAAMAHHGLPCEPELQHLRGSHEQNGYDAMNALLDLAQPPSAIYVSSPILAIGAASAASERGMTNPAELSIISFGKAGWHSIWPGGMTSVQLPIDEMVDLAAAMLLDGQTDPAGEGQGLIMVRPNLEVRGSTGQPFIL